MIGVLEVEFHQGHDRIMRRATAFTDKGFHGMAVEGFLADELGQPSRTASLLWTLGPTRGSRRRGVFGLRQRHTGRGYVIRQTMRASTQLMQGRKRPPMEWHNHRTRKHGHAEGRMKYFLSPAALTFQAHSLTIIPLVMYVAIHVLGHRNRYGWVFFFNVLYFFFPRLLPGMGHIWGMALGVHYRKEVDYTVSWQKDCLDTVIWGRRYQRRTNNEEML